MLVDSASELVWEQYIRRVVMGAECEKIANELKKYGVSATQWNALAQVIAEEEPNAWTQHIQDAATRLNSKWKDHGASMISIMKDIYEGNHNCWEFRRLRSFREKLSRLGVRGLGHEGEPVPFPNEDVKIKGARLILIAAIRLLLEKQVQG